MLVNSFLSVDVFVLFVSTYVASDLIRGRCHNNSASFRDLFIYLGFWGGDFFKKFLVILL